MNTTLVIGYGNSLRSDDGAGIRAVERIGDRYAHVDTLIQHELTAELAETVAKYGTLVFVDAVANSEALTMEKVASLKGAGLEGSHSHSPEAILSLSRQLYDGKPEKVIIIGIPAYSFEFGEQLSPETEQAIAELVNTFEEIVGPFGGTHR